MANLVAIVGRPNVGKSTLFNRLIQERTSIVDEISGVTRDRIYGTGDWNGKFFSLIDTGGYTVNSTDIFEKEIVKQVEIAIEEADAILFLVDVNNGITDLDHAVAEILRKTDKKVFLVVNKIDNHDRQYESTVFYSLGLGDYFNISALNGSGTGDLLDKLVESFEISEEEHDNLPKFSVIGRPNVGKSTLINTLIGEERNIVTPLAGTTRDSIYTKYNKFNHEFYLIDTAGLRRKSKINEDIEYYSIVRAIRAIEKSDVCLIMIDALRGVESQDLNILNMAIKNNKGVVILVNKWDAIDKETSTSEKFKKKIYEKIAPFTDVPILFISALTKQRIFNVLETAFTVFKNKKRKIKTSELNRIILEAIDRNQPPAEKGRYVKIKYVTQLVKDSPVFLFYSNFPKYIKQPYIRYLENQIRKNFNFSGVPIRIFCRKK